MKVILNIDKYLILFKNNFHYLIDLNCLTLILYLCYSKLNHFKEKYRDDYLRFTATN